MYVNQSLATVVQLTGGSAALKMEDRKMQDQNYENLYSPQNGRNK